MKGCFKGIVIVDWRLAEFRGKGVIEYQTDREAGSLRWCMASLTEWHGGFVPRAGDEPRREAGCGLKKEESHGSVFT